MPWRGTSVGGGVHGFESRGKKDFKSQDKRSKGPLEPKWWPKWILIKSQDKRPPTVNALAQQPQEAFHNSDPPARVAYLNTRLARGCFLEGTCFRFVEREPGGEKTKAPLRVPP